MRDRLGRRGSVALIAPAILVVAAVLLTAIVPLGHPGAAPPRSGTSRPDRTPVRVAAAPPVASALAFSPLPANWTPLTSSKLTPPPREAGGLTFDPTTGAFVLFGGLGFLSAPLADTWTFADGNWTNLTGTLAVAPPARWYASVTWDAADGYAVLFGGRNGTSNLDDTWTFNGTAWTKQNTSSAPPALASGRLTYDAADGYVLLSGGLNTGHARPTPFNITWSYRAGTWTNLTGNVTGGIPDARAITNSAYDATDGYVLFFGGTGATGSACTAPGYTWSYAGGRYTNLSGNLTSAPPGSFGSRMMADDPAYAGVVLYGGFEQAPCGISSQTWLFHAGAWYNVTPTFGPGPLWDGQMAADPQSESVLLFSGVNATGASNVTWNFTPALSVTAAVNATMGLAPLPVNLTASAVGLGPLSFNWSFADGSPAGHGANVTHTFVAAGVYHPDVVVTDLLGRQRSATVALTVVADLGVNASAYPAIGDAPLAVSFSQHTVGGQAPFAYNWSFGDGSTNTSGHPAHTYVSPGRYNWSVTTSDALGEKVAANGTVTVNPPLAITAFNLSRGIGVAPFTVYGNITAVNGTGLHAASWNFGDGSPSVIGGFVSHTFTLAGVFHGHVTMVDVAGDQVSESFNVTAVAPLEASVAASPLVGVTPLQVSFSASILGGDAPFTYNWSFGLAGATSNLTAPSFVYTAAGVFQANVSVGDAAGEVVVASTTITVGHPLLVNFTEPIYVGIAPANLTFRAVTMGGLGPFTAQWTFGDGAAAAGGLNISHFYLHPGTFHVQATVTDRAGDSFVAAGSALVVAALAVSLSANLSSVEAGSPLTFTATTSGGDPPLTARWVSVLPGCEAPAGNSLTLNCTPNATGTFTTTVQVLDALGESRNASTIVEVSNGGSSAGSSPFKVWSSPLPYLVVGVGVVVLILLILLVRSPRANRPRRGT